MGEDTEGSEAAGAKFLAEVARLLKPRSGLGVRLRHPSAGACPK